MTMVAVTSSPAAGCEASSRAEAPGIDPALPPTRLKAVADFARPTGNVEPMNLRLIILDPQKSRIVVAIDQKIEFVEALRGDA
jgi:hypothetical protein